MSWTVDGVRYHDHAEYQAVLRAHELRVAANRADALQREVEAARYVIDSREAELEQARGDLEAQTRVAESLSNDVRGLARSQSRLEQASREMERSLSAGLEASAAKLRRGLDDVRGAIAAARSEAEAARRRTEAALRASLERVEQEQRRELERREARAADRAERCQGALELALSMVDATTERHTPLGLLEQADAIREEIRQAGLLAARSDESSALALAHTAAGQARMLDQNVRRRQAELDAARESVVERARSLRKLLSGEALRRYFEVEGRRAGGILDRVEDGLAGRYSRYARKESEGERDDRLLGRLEESVSLMVASTGVIGEMARERKKALERSVEQLAQVHGALSGMEQRLATPGDRKSPLVVDCDFGGAKVQVVLELNGRQTIQGYGYGDDYRCARAGEAMVRASLDSGHAVDGRIEERDRDHALPVPAAAAPGWTEIGARLRELEESA